MFDFLQAFEIPFSQSTNTNYNVHKECEICHKILYLSKVCMSAS